MEYRIPALIKALKNLPRPERAGDFHKIAVYSPPCFDPNRTKPGKASEETIPVLVLRAERFHCGGRRWLEWLVDI